jgi:hypothetical protein
MELAIGDLKMTKNVSVKPYKRKIKGKIYKVKSHKRSVRKLGKKIRYSDAGRFQVAHDELGNIRGSRIVKTKKRKSNSSKIKRKRSPDINRILKERRLYDGISELDSDFFLGNISKEEWMKKRTRLEKDLS